MSTPTPAATLPPANRLTRGDVIAGISVALVLIPQSLAYAELAGLPAYFGLYAAAIPPLAAAFFASSRYLQTGPVAMTALLTFGALSAFAQPFSREWIELAALLALIVGGARVALGLVRGGVIAYFMSQPVLIGFTTAAAILIVSSLLPTALGVEADGETILRRLWWTAIHPAEWEAAAIVLSVMTVVLVAGGRRLHRLFPGVLVAVVLGLAFSVVFDYDGLRVGEVDLNLPGSPLRLPWGDFWALLVPGSVIALVGFAEPASIARIFAAQDRERWSPNKELISQGQGGKIVNVSSAAGKSGTANTLAYVAGCFAQVGMTQSLAKELGPYGINVNCVCPGSVDTSRLDDLRWGEAWDELARSTPIRRNGTDDELGEFIAYLCTKAASWIHGQSINIDGGLVMEH